MHSKKKFLVILLLAIVALAIGLQVNSILNRSGDLTNRDTKLEFKVEALSGKYKPINDSLDTTTLEKVLALIGQSSSPYKFGLLQGPARFEPQVVEFQFGDISELAESQKSNLSYKQTVSGEIVKGFTSNFDDETKTLTYSIYYNYDLYQNHLEYLENDWEKAIIHVLFAGSLKDKPFTYEELNTLNKSLELNSVELIKAQDLVSYRSSIKIVLSIFQDLKSHFQVSKAYAACNGYFSCGTIDYVCSSCPNSGICSNELCSDGTTPCTCSNQCVGNWAISCSVRGSENACNNPTTACWSGCLAATQCYWSASNPNEPTPLPDPSPGGGGTTTCYRCVNQAACAVTTSTEPCGCYSCVTQRAKKAVVLFEDLDEDGLWEPEDGEHRITSSGCTSGYTMQLPGANILIGGQPYYDKCNVGDNEYTQNACSETYTCPNNSGTFWTPDAIATTLEIERTCFAVKECSCGAGCSGQGNCQSETAKGNLCAYTGYCNPGVYNLKEGPYNIVGKETATYTVAAQFPIGWRPAAGAPTQAQWASTTNACEGTLFYGLHRVEEKWCKVSPVNSATTTTGGPINLNVTGYSTFAQEEVRLTLITKQPAPSTAPTSLQIVDYNGQPVNVPGTTWTNSNGRYYYNFNSTGCVVGNSSTPCSSLVAVSGLPAGEYYVSCAVNADNGQRCTGNPNCTHEGLGGTVNCTGQQSCSTGSPDDNATIQVTCSSTCGAIACGQSNGCGGTCGTTSTGAPPTPVPMVSQNLTVNDSLPQHSVNLTWTAGTYTGTPPAPPTTRYDLVIAKQAGTVTNATTAGQAFNQCETACPGFTSSCDTTFNGTPIRCAKHNNLASLSYSYTPQIAISNKIAVAVRAVNQSCIAYGQGYWGGFSNPVNYNLVQNITGLFFDDPDMLASGSPVCLGPPNPTTPPGPNSNLEVISPTPNTLIPTNVSYSSNYTVFHVPYSPASWVEAKNTLRLTIDNSGNGPEEQIVCTCPDGCEYVQNINSPHNSVNFYLTTVDLSTESWWQVVSGLLYSARDTLASVIPQECKDDLTGTCIPYLMTQEKTIVNDPSRDLSSGIPLSGAGDVSGGNKTVWLTERVPQARGSEATTHTQMERENFVYFQSKFDYNNLPELSAPSGTIVDMPSPNATYKHVGNLAVEPGSTPWRVNPGESLIIFVEGTVTFRGESPTSSNAVIQVEEGGFLAFITSGNIIFDANVGNADPSSVTNAKPAVAGVFITDGSIIVEATSNPTQSDKHFVGAGTFVAWDESNSGQGIQLNRNYSDSGLGALDNKLYPTETFMYRPDFVYNMPLEMSSTDLFWQEVN